MIQAIIFDMDGLMFDTERLAKEAWIQVGQQMGYPIDEPVIRQIRGATPQASAEVFRQAYGDGFDYPAAKALRNSLVAEIIERDGLPIKKGLIMLLNDLRKRGICCAVASSSPVKTIEKFLTMACIWEFFSVIVGAEDVCRSKPAPDCFLLAAQRMQAKREDCIVLEDSANGLYAAKAAGMRCICIPDLSVPAAAIENCGAAVLSRLDMVTGWLQEHG